MGTPETMTKEEKTKAFADWLIGEVTALSLKIKDLFPTPVNITIVVRDPALAKANGGGEMVYTDEDDINDVLPSIARSKDGTVGMRVTVEPIRRRVPEFTEVKDGEIKDMADVPEAERIATIGTHAEREAVTFIVRSKKEAERYVSLLLLHHQVAVIATKTCNAPDCRCEGTTTVRVGPAAALPRN